METPYGEIPDKFVPDMRPQEMHDFLRKRYGRRTILKAGAIGAAAAAAGPLFWRQSSAFAAGPSAPQWIAYGPDPTTSMYISWSVGSYNTPAVAPSPQVQWGTTSAYGASQAASGGTVPIPAGYTQPSGDIDDTVYLHTLLTGLTPNTTYHYAVSNDGSTWSSDVTFTTAPLNPSSPWKFAVTGDEATSSTTTSPIAQLIAAISPQFTVVAGDLSYASGGVLLPTSPGTQPAYTPSAWDTYFSLIGPTAQSVPWITGVGNHEMEPLTNDGYAGFLTRFPQPYDTTSGSPVVQTFTAGNVAFIQLDGNDLSAEIAPNNGYTGGGQTAWLKSKLAAYRSPGSYIDFIVVYFHNCMFCSNTTHGSDGGIRSVWQSIFDQYEVDVVFNGHVHAYERSHPVKGTTVGNAPTGSTVDPTTAGTTYICAGGGGQSLYTSWYGPSGPGSDTPTLTSTPKVWEFGTSDGPSGGTGTVADVSDSITGYSAFRRAVWSCLRVTVTPAAAGASSTMLIEALDPTQTVSGGISSISNPTVMDNVTLTRTSVGPNPALPEFGNTALLGVAGAAVLGAGAYAVHRRNEREKIVLQSPGQGLN